MTTIDEQIISLEKQLKEAIAGTRAPNSPQGFSLSEYGRKQNQLKVPFLQNQLLELRRQKAKSESIISDRVPTPPVTAPTPTVTTPSTPLPVSDRITETRTATSSPTSLAVPLLIGAGIILIAFTRKGKR